MAAEPGAVNGAEAARFRRLYGLVLVALAVEIAVLWAISRAFQ